MRLVGDGLIDDPSLSQRGDARREAARVASLVLQLGLALALAWAFHIENPAFYLRILPLAVGGAIVNHLLPLRHRPTFFAALGIFSILLVFGLGPGGWMVGLGLTLIGLCHLPIPFGWRLGLIGLSGAILMLMRAGWIGTPWPGVIWPIFASMFMFRLGLYLYDLKHYGPMRPDLVLSYFFLLPNVVFLLFPVLDFHTYRRTYYDRKALDIYEEGAQWILRGLTHLVLYRLIYTYVAISPAEVTSTAGLVRYLLGNYGLYLRVSGQFHMIVGLLHLFGFRLPETHRFFYLASSFSDFWRRMNIYWKEFMQKMVYMPAALGLRKRNETQMLIGATLCVLAASWFLRSYQWFWLIGEWLFSATDIVFWGILGTFLVANSLWEQRRGRARQLTARAPAPRHAWREAAQTAGMFGLMCVLWGFWTSPTFGDFEALLRAFTLRGVDIAAVATTLAVVAVAAWVSRRLSLGTPSALAVRRWWQHPLLNAALPLGLLWAVGEPTASAWIPAKLQGMARQARAVELNKYDAERLQRGYYEKIVGVNRFNGELWEVYARAEKVGGKEAPERLRDVGVLATRRDSLHTELRPSATAEFKGGVLSTNRWGMRDRDYKVERAADTRRIAVLGPSYVMGVGVNDGEPFESVVEDRLNREWSPKTGLHYELLNFAVSGYSVAQQAIVLENGRVSAFQPDFVLLIGNVFDVRQLFWYVWKEVTRGRTLPSPAAELIRQAGVERGMSELEAEQRFACCLSGLTKWALGDVARSVRRMGAKPLYALIPTPGQSEGSSEQSFLISSAQVSGFTVLDTLGVYSGYDWKNLVLASDSDRHPNANGHRVIADRLFQELTKSPQLLSTGALSDSQDVSIPAPSFETFKQEWWSIETHGGAVAKLERSAVEPGLMRVSIDVLPKPVRWFVKVQETGLPINEGHKYVLSFRARSDAPRSIACAAGRNAAPWGLLGLYRDVNLKADWGAFECPFVATRTDSNARIFFDLGGSTRPVELSDVVLRNLSTGQDVAPSFTPAEPVRRKPRGPRPPA